MSDDEKIDIFEDDEIEDEDEDEDEDEEDDEADDEDEEDWRTIHRQQGDCIRQRTY